MLTDCYLAQGDIAAASTNHDEVEALFFSLKEQNFLS